jgi:glycosyltransferase involved in cell wall biosynthesis
MHTKKQPPGNLLMVANYPSDTSYAWWLMEHFWEILAEQFKSNGKQTFLAYPVITSLTDTVKNAAIEPVELTLPWQSLVQAWQALKFLRKNNITSIYFTDQNFFSFKYFMMRLCGVKHITIHDHTPGDRPPAHGIKGALKTIINTIPWCTADKILCVSQLMQERNIATSRIPAHKCIVVQNGITPINCDSTNKFTLRKDLRVSNNSILVITTGRANPYKRFDFIIETAHEFKKQEPESDVIFLLVGDGPAMPDLQQQINKLKLEDTVLLLGFRTDVPDILCASDIAFHAALGEGFSLSIIEYMSAGMPVLVPDIPSVSQAITHAQTGLIYKHDDPMAAAAYIAELTNNQQNRLAMGKAAKDEADNIYNLEQCTRSFMNSVSVLK